MNSCLIKFEDGYTMVTSRDAATGDLFRSRIEAAE
jgi:hypothetical protein